MSIFDFNSFVGGFVDGFTAETGKSIEQSVNDITGGVLGDLSLIPQSTLGLVSAFNSLPVFVPTSQSPEDIWSFMAKLQGDLARPNRFRLQINMPNGVSPIGSLWGGASGGLGNGLEVVSPTSQEGAINIVDHKLNGKGQINVKCHTMSMPDRNIQTTPVRQSGFNLNIPYAVQYEPITLSFYVDKNYDTVKYFNTWQSSILNFSNNTVNFFNEYAADINLYAMDRTGSDVYGVTLYQAYPISISSLPFGYQDNNSIQSVHVTFAYKYWLSQDSGQFENRTT